MLRNSDISTLARTLKTLGDIVGGAFDQSRFYDTVDLQVLEEETTRYNDEYEKAIQSGSEYGRVGIFKAEQMSLDK